MFALGHELANTPSHKFDLEHMRILLRALGHPEKDLSSVLIAGTNGKGSTAATLASILRASSLKTGLYTSPHLIRINERIRISGEQIGDDDFARLHGEVDNVAESLVERAELPWHPSFFEMMTAIAFTHFARQRVDVAILEVGMGGRLDATNVVDPLLSVITDISLDHQKYLGNTVSEIASEKAGVIRPGGIVVTLPQQPAANDVIGNVILELDATAVSAVPYVPPVSPASTQYILPSGKTSDVRSRYPLELMGQQIVVETPLVGRHQLRNVALAIAAAEQLGTKGVAGITAESIERGIRNTAWPGRFQVLEPRDAWPEIVLDVAHNPAGAWALRSALSERYDDRPLIFVFAAMRDKAISDMAEILFPLAEQVIATRPANPRAASPEEIVEAANRTGTEIKLIPDVGAALEHARDLAERVGTAPWAVQRSETSGAPKEGVVVITGSIYLVGEAMHILGLSV